MTFKIKLTPDQLTLLKASPLYNSNCSKPNGSASSFGETQPIRQTKQIASKSGSCRATPAVGPGFCSCKGVVASAPPTSRSDSKSDEHEAPEKGIPASSHANTFAPSHASAPALAESTLAHKYSKADLMGILKIFLKTKGQEPKAEVPRKQPLKAKVPDVYFGKLHIDCYHCCL